jgi:hypothetical protein
MAHSCGGLSKDSRKVAKPQRSEQKNPFAANFANRRESKNKKELNRRKQRERRKIIDHSLFPLFSPVHTFAIREDSRDSRQKLFCLLRVLAGAHCPFQPREGTSAPADNQAAAVKLPLR